MSARSFFDTNILIYADDKASPSKQKRAIELVCRRAGTGVVSLQVLQEYFVTVTRKLGLDAAIARRKVELLAEFDVVTPEVSDILAAIDLHRLHLDFWDALVLRAAKQAGCTVLLSEDTVAREVDGVRIVNPFWRFAASPTVFLRLCQFPKPANVSLWIDNRCDQAHVQQCRGHRRRSCASSIRRKCAPFVGSRATWLLTDLTLTLK